MKQELNDIFYARYYKDAELLIQAPTRINIIGEHTDYNGGFVMPAAINYFIYFAMVKTTTAVAFIHDENKQQNFSFDLDEKLELDALSQWRKYYYGAIKILQEEHELGGFQVLKLGKAPVGAGISSSAALCCGFIYGLSELFDLGLDRWTIAKMAQRVEQEYVGLQCGIMDQFAVLFGEQNKVLNLNCAKLTFETHPYKLKDYTFVLCNSGVKHNLADSAYNERVEEMKQVQALLGKDDLNAIEPKEIETLPEKLAKRMTHLYMENRRVTSMQEALVEGNWVRAGTVLHASHISLKELYEVTCVETDFLVDALWDGGAEGARQMGGGFGGCVLALVHKERVGQLQAHVEQEYKEKFNLDAEFYFFEITDGVKTMA